MSLRQTGINENLYKRLTGIIAGGNVMHAYVFESSFGPDKEQLALEFAKAILCSDAKRKSDADFGGLSECSAGDACDVCPVCRRIDHGNFEDIVFAEVSASGSVKDEAIEKLQEELKRKPLVGDRKIAIIPCGDTLTQRAQNRLLKTLEEPQGNAVIIILAENIENLIQTIRSRCVIFRVSDYSKASENSLFSLASEIAEMLISREPTYRLFGKLADVFGDRGQVLEFMDALELVYRDLLVNKSPKSRLYKRQYIYSAVSLLEEARRSILSSVGINATYVLKNVLLRIGG